jgi:PIN domain nuclease of toxin-antitoxin system
VKILTDTHTLVWALSNPKALGVSARHALASSPFTASVANLWELILKARRPAALVGDPLPWWQKYVVQQGIPALGVHTRHIVALAALAEIHKDPFDRILVAQAVSEGLILASKDSILRQYGAPVIWD